MKEKHKMNYLHISFFIGEAGEKEGCHAKISGNVQDLKQRPRIDTTISDEDTVSKEFEVVDSS